jgi:tetratricopeptide (TPR) repeat protein
MTSFTGSRPVVAAGALIALFTSVVGCGPSPVYRETVVPAETMNAYLQDKPPELRPMYERALLEGNRNLVLNQLRAGLGAMDIGEVEVAENSFDTALGGIETVYANNERAAKARSLWYEEGMKDFKGEPYERAMAYYYRGLLYLRRADFDNARACFKSGVLQDAFAEEDQHRCDFALLIFLEGWASQCLGDKGLATVAYEEVKRLRPDFVLPAWDHNVLLIAETGTSPRKVADGIGHYELKFRRGRGITEQSVRITLGPDTYPAYPIEDVAWQAMTRGGRPVDKILKGKAIFRETHEEIGSVLTQVSVTASVAAPVFEHSRSNIEVVSRVLGIFGVAEIVMASNVGTRADTRYWDNLPDGVHILTWRSTTPGQTVQVSFLDPLGSEATELRREVEIDPVDGQHGLGWIRSRSALSTVQ